MRQTLSARESRYVAAQHTDVLRGLYRVSRALGWLGLFLPTALIVHGLGWNGGLPLSISHTYHSAMGDVLVGTLFAIGVFLIAYKDFNPEEYVGGPPDEFLTRYWDRWFARAAGIGAIGVALFPVDPVTVLTCAPIVTDAPVLPCSTGGVTWHGHVSLTTEGGAVANLLHFLPAALFFSCTCVICIRFFPEEPIKARYMGRNADGQYEIEVFRPSRRTVVFTSYGIGIALCIAGLVYMTMFESDADAAFIPFLEAYHGFFWLEVIAVVLFALAWLTKSRDFELPRALGEEAAS